MKIFCELRLYFLLFSFFICSIGFSQGLSCKDENNNDVDWFLIYKLPKISSEDPGSKLSEGNAYAYISSREKEVSNWELSSIGIESEESMLGRTWQGIGGRRKENGVSYLFYNDASPIDKKSAVGHAKGFLTFDGNSGFWVLHTIPKFGISDRYEYPDSGRTFGQVAICMTFGGSAFKDICDHLLHCNPNIYERHLADNVLNTLDGNAITLFDEKPKFIRTPPFVKTAVVKSLEAQMFYLFAKDNQHEQDIYSNIIAPTLKTSLKTETWRNGAGGFLDPFCGADYSVIDISAIKMKVKSEDKEIRFKSTDDHSKWAISQSGDDSWICIGDLNRMDSQAKRGGGAICFKSRTVWRAFNSLIFESGVCPQELTALNRTSNSTNQTPIPSLNSDSTNETPTPSLICNSTNQTPIPSLIIDSTNEALSPSSNSSNLDPIPSISNSPNLTPIDSIISNSTNLTPIPSNNSNSTN